MHGKRAALGYMYRGAKTECKGSSPGILMHGNLRIVRHYQSPAVIHPDKIIGVASGLYPVRYTQLSGVP